MTAALQTADPDLAEQMMQFVDDPYGFVMYAYPWGEPKTELENEPGPDANQAQFLIDLGREVKRRGFNGSDPVMPILMAESSGHGTGKSVMGAWLADWILSTRPYSIGTVTANTYPQLESRTWAAIQRWTRLCITGHWFHVKKKGIYPRTDPEGWKVVAQTCKAENAQSFAGQHARTSTSWYMFDEASHIPDEVWDVAGGGLTDGEPMFFCWGQPARKSGRFYEICFGKMRDRWNVRLIDSRLSRFTNKEYIAQLIQDYGEDSDYVRVRVKGEAPRAGDLQFIDQDRIDGAKRRNATSFADDPLVAGFDVSGGGQAWNVIWFRRGADARSIPPIRIPGEHSQERSAILAKLAEILSDRRPGRRVSMMFVDSAYGAPYVERLRTQFDNIQEVNFGGPSPDRHQANMRAYMWQKLKDWLERGSIPADDVVLETDLCAPGSHLNRRDQLVLESKEEMAKRNVASPDCFIAGTLIQTSTGPRPIEQIAIGDSIVTPFGYSPVIAKHVTETDSLTTAQFSNSTVLVGKGKHEIFTYSGGMKRIDALTFTDEVEILTRWRLALWRLVSLCCIGERSFGFKQQAATFSRGVRIRRKDFCIVGYGAMRTALYRKVSRFITAIAIGEITIPPIWNWCLSANINAITCGIDFSIPQRSSRIEIGSSWHARRPRSGTDQKWESNGISSTEWQPGKDENQLMPNASCAERNIRRSFQSDPTTVPAPALNGLPFGAISRTLASAHGAVKNLWRTVTGRRPVVPVHVATASVPPTRTYNLTLAEHNAYYANDILVFNCGDALALTFAAHVPPVAATQEP